MFDITYRGDGGFSKAVSLAMTTAVAGESPNCKLDYLKLPVTVGVLQCVRTASAAVTTASNVKID